MNEIDTNFELEEILLQKSPNTNISLGEDIENQVPLKKIEEFLYNQFSDFSSEDNYHEIIYLFLLFASDLFLKLIISACMIVMFESKRDITWAFICSLYIYYHVFKIFCNAYFYLRFQERIPGFHVTYKFDGLLSLGYMIVFIGFYLFLRGIIKTNNLILFMLPHCLLCVLRFMIKRVTENIYIPFASYYLFESIQLIYLAYRCEYLDDRDGWLWALLFYYFVNIILFVLAIVLVVVFAILFIAQIIVIIFSKEKRKYLHISPILFTFGVIFYFIWIGFSGYYALFGFQQLLDENSLKDIINKSIINEDLYNIATFILICSSITLIILVSFFVYVREVIIKLLRQYRGIKVSLLSFAKDLKLNIVSKSSNLFGHRDNLSKEPGIQEIEMMPKANHFSTLSDSSNKCYICCMNNSEILLYPCNHSGICKDCTQDLLKRNDECPQCKKKIQKIYIIYFNKVKQSYMAKGVINFSKV